jgi:lipopolysaccharide biosynthesis protein
MSGPYPKLYKYGSSFWDRFRHPKRYETGLLTLIWFYGLESIRARVRPSCVISLPFENSKLVAEEPSGGVAVVVHCFYTELLDELLGYIKNIPFNYRLFISTDTSGKKAWIVDQLNRLKFKNYDVRIVENRGRDIAPKLITFRDVYQDSTHFIHLHTKKSSYLGQWGDEWRRYLLASLLGSSEIISNIFSILNYPEVGLVFPEPFEFNLPQLRWENNFEKAALLAKRMKIPISKRYCPHFPVGSMFWGKTEAIRPLLDLDLKFDDFIEESGQRNGELEHAIERMIGVVANAQGLYGQRVSIRNDSRYIKISNSEELSEAIIRCAQNGKTQ